MSRLLSNLLSFIGSLRIRTSVEKTVMDVGDPTIPDAQGSAEWRNFATTEALYAVWGPPSGSPWEPYHCVPLFASLQTIPPDRIGPGTPQQNLQVDQHPLFHPSEIKKPLAAAWATQQTLAILDIPGMYSVPMAVRLMASGFQPVCTFDNWPHWVGLIKSELALAQLLRFASTAKILRENISPQSSPVWVCDRDRLGDRAAKPREFDNRYYLDDSILPSPETLRKNGISQIVCVVPEASMMPRDDLRSYFRDLRKENFSAIYGASLQDSELGLFPVPSETFEINFKQNLLNRNDAGGFGVLVPEPSSSGG